MEGGATLEWGSLERGDRERVNRSARKDPEDSELRWAERCVYSSAVRYVPLSHPGPRRRRHCCLRQKQQSVNSRLNLMVNVPEMRVTSHARGICKLVCQGISISFLQPWESSN